MNGAPPADVFASSFDWQALKPFMTLLAIVEILFFVVMLIFVLACCWQVTREIREDGRTKDTLRLEASALAGEDTVSIQHRAAGLNQPRNAVTPRIEVNVQLQPNR
ncbi:MAG: hypothetical protein HY736_21085 [Verrucomicrobia bacterium]|nr:hypothetical protein [Verrucomicrobiota bacterium]